MHCRRGLDRAAPKCSESLLACHFKRFSNRIWWIWPSRLRRQIVALKIVGSSPIIHPKTRDRTISGFSLLFSRYPYHTIEASFFHRMCPICGYFFAPIPYSTVLTSFCAGFSAQDDLILWIDFACCPFPACFFRIFGVILSTGSALSVDNFPVKCAKNPGADCG